MGGGGIRGDEIPIFQSPISPPFFPGRRRPPPQSPLYKSSPRTHRDIFPLCHTHRLSGWCARKIRILESGKMGEIGGKVWKMGTRQQIRMEMQGQHPEWEKTGGNGSQWDKTPVFTVPFPPFFPRLKTFPTVPFAQINSPHSPTEKWDIIPLSGTHRHSGCAEG